MKKRLQKLGFLAWNKSYKRVSVHFLIRYPLFFYLFLLHLIVLMWCFFVSLEVSMKKFFQLFLIYPHILAFLAGYSLRDKKPRCTLTTKYTFIRYVPVRGESSSRMKVRQDPPAPPGYNGKQGGERFRTILKYPTATDMAMKRYRANDTSLRSWRRTRQRWETYGPDSLSGVWWFPYCAYPCIKQRSERGQAACGYVE